MHTRCLKINRVKVGHFRLKILGDDYLLTNDTGDYIFLSPQAFQQYLHGDLERAAPDIYQELEKKSFIRDKLDFEGLGQKYALRNIFLERGPSLHIIVVTLRCDHKCIYCQAGSQGLSAKGFDLDIETAEKIVDNVFDSSSQDITIEFQGGEPLLNLKVIKHIVAYALEKNKLDNKNLQFSLVTNLTFVNKSVFNFIKKNNISVCVSLDGKEHLHNAQRIFKNGNSYRNTERWLKIFVKEFKSGKIKSMPQALITVTRQSLSTPREIIDTYVKLGLTGIHLRPVTPYGIGSKIWKKVKFLPEEFIKFYAQSLDYIIELNVKKGIYFYERTAKIIISKIFGDADPNFLDLRSPCGAGIGQIAYNFNGDVYSCDEARMLSRANDESFRLGNVNFQGYKEFIGSDVVKTLAISSCLDNIPSCTDCVYKPYCGVCPIYNYCAEGDIFSHTPANNRCRIQKGIFDYLFTKLRQPQIKEVFLRWLNQSV